MSLKKTKAEWPKCQTQLLERIVSLNQKNGCRSPRSAAGNPACRTCQTQLPERAPERLVCQRKQRLTIMPKVSGSFGLVSHARPAEGVGGLYTDTVSGGVAAHPRYIYLKGFAPMRRPLLFWWNGGYEAKWLRKSGSLAWLGAWKTLGKTKKGFKIKL